MTNKSIGGGIQNACSVNILAAVGDIVYARGIWVEGFCGDLKLHGVFPDIIVLATVATKVAELV